MTGTVVVSPIMAGLMDHRVNAQIKDLDHYRIHGGMAVETDYIIHVTCVNTGTKTRSEPDFDTFIISKNFSAFRTLVDQLHESADAFMTSAAHAKLPSVTKQKVKKLAQYCEIVSQLVDSQRTQYLGKVNYMYVKVLSKQRSQIIAEVLEVTLSSFPTEIESHPFLAEVAKRIEAFFLTDHCASVEDEAGEDSNVSSLFITPIKKNYHQVNSTIKATKSKSSTTKALFTEKTDAGSPDSQDSGIVDNTPPQPGFHRNLSSPVVPISRKPRRSERTRSMDEDELKKSGAGASLLVDDERSQAAMVPSYSAPVPTVSLLGSFMDNNPFIFAGIFIGLTQVLRHAAGMVVTLDLDIFLLVVFSAFCIGLHTPRPLVGGVDHPPSRDKRRRHRRRRGGSTPTSAANLLRASMVSPRGTPGSARRSSGIGYETNTIEEEQEEGDAGAEMEDGEGDMVLQSPMARFPEGAEIGSILNCTSDPPCSNFMVRGAKYLSDRKKVKSGSYIFPSRGADLFLTDTCPENVGRIGGILGGDLRDSPTFLLNFRLPWGVLIFYYEIPERFVPFVKGCYKDPSVDRTELEKTMKSFSNEDRCCARFLLGDDEHKKHTLKIFPGVVQGPWVVKSVVGGKPAIIGTKLPVNYVYQPESKAKDGTKQALYLEADLDIVSSSAARGILSAVRTYTQDLTLDLGFAVQGNHKDELPECMLFATRLHGIDPMNAPALPPMKDLMIVGEGDSDDDDDTTDRG